MGRRRIFLSEWWCNAGMTDWGGGLKLAERRQILGALTVYPWLVLIEQTLQLFDDLMS